MCSSITPNVNDDTDSDADGNDDDDDTDDAHVFAEAAAKHCFFVTTGAKTKRKNRKKSFRLMKKSSSERKPQSKDGVGSFVVDTKLE